MSSIDPSAAQTALFEKLGISKNTDVKKATSDTLGQSDFLKLMTTQLQNQDPLSPIDHGNFMIDDFTSHKPDEIKVYSVIV